MIFSFFYEMWKWVWVNECSVKLFLCPFLRFCDSQEAHIPRLTIFPWEFFSFNSTIMSPTRILILCVILWVVIVWLCVYVLFDSTNTDRFRTIVADNRSKSLSIIWFEKEITTAVGFGIIVIVSYRLKQRPLSWVTFSTLLQWLQC
jgi:hypothetical protein